MRLGRPHPRRRPPDGAGASPLASQVAVPRRQIRPGMPVIGRRRRFCSAEPGAERRWGFTVARGDAILTADGESGECCVWGGL